MRQGLFCCCARRMTLVPDERLLCAIPRHITKNAARILPRTATWRECRHVWPPQWAGDPRHWWRSDQLRGLTRYLRPTYGSGTPPYEAACLR